MRNRLGVVEEPKPPSKRLHRPKRPPSPTGSEQHYMVSGSSHSSRMPGGKSRMTDDTSQDTSPERPTSKRMRSEAGEDWEGVDGSPSESTSNSI